MIHTDRTVGHATQYKLYTLYNLGVLNPVETYTTRNNGLKLCHKISMTDGGIFLWLPYNFLESNTIVTLFFFCMKDIKGICEAKQI